MEEDLAGAGVLRRRGAVDERLVLRYADEDLVQLELVERALATLDHGCRSDLPLDHRLDPLHAVEIEVRLDPCKLKDNNVVATVGGNNFSDGLHTCNLNARGVTNISSFGTYHCGRGEQGG